METSIATHEEGVGQSPCGLSSSMVCACDQPGLRKSVMSARAVFTLAASLVSQELLLTRLSFVFSELGRFPHPPDALQIVVSEVANFLAWGWCPNVLGVWKAARALRSYGTRGLPLYF